jgi:hypothetical protein
VKRLLFTLVFVAGLVLVGYFIRKGYCLPWTGFGTAIDGDGKLQPAKTLWDWLELLIVPIFLAVGAWALDGSRKKSDSRVEADRQRQSTLDDYLKSMTDMLIEGKLTGPSAIPAAKDIARTRTLAALRGLDGARKAQLLQFLYEAGLIGPAPVVQLNGADLGGAQLDESVLRGVELRGVYFPNASFKRATLVDADLRGSDFAGADFSGANLKGANLIQANLSGAKVDGKALSQAKTE